MICSLKQQSRGHFTSCILLILPLFFLSVAGQTTICPVGSTSCTYFGYDNQFIYGMTCTGLGSLNTLPTACTSNPLQTLIILDLTVSPNGTSISTIQTGALSGLRVRNLILSNLGIKSVNDAAFDSLATDIQSLVLSGNQLTSLPSGVFMTLASLTSLRLDHNMLSSLPTGVFSTLANLKELNLDHNRLTSLPIGVFSSLSKLTTLTLGNNLIAGLSTGVFSNLPSLISLTLNNNALVTLPIGTFSQLSSLSSLSLTGNQLTTISAPVFSGVVALTSLGLASNRIQSIDSGIWRLMPLLTELDLSDNLLNGSISSEFVSSLSRLQDLRLGGNSLTELTTEAMSQLVGLQRLNVSRNSLTQLSENLFVNNTQLLEVDLSFNAINYTAPNVFNGTFKMKTLLLNDNRLPALPVYGTGNYMFRDMSSLLVLHLQNNRIAGLVANALSGLTLVRDLDLSNNMISTLPLGIFDPLGLAETLSVANNQITRVDPKPFVSMKNLVQLNANNNRITAVTSDWFVTTSRLSTVNLSSNLISTIDATSFGNMSALSYIDLSDNQLNTVDGLFSKCHSLRSINLARNPIRNLTNATVSTFAGLTLLERLNLSTTCLTSVSFGQSNTLANLQQLDLSGNALSMLTADMFSGLPSIQSLNLQGNNIAQIGTSTFSQLTKLVALNLSMNFLQSDSQLTAALSQVSSSTKVDLSWNQISMINSIPLLSGGIYLHGNPITCACNAPSWMTSNNFLYLLDSADVSCLSAQLTPQNLACYSMQCNIATTSSLVETSCTSQTTGDTSYLFPGQVHQPSVCPWDPPVPTTSTTPATTATLPRSGMIVSFDVIASSTGVVVRWNSTNSTVRVTLLAGTVRNVTDPAGNLINGTLYNSQNSNQNEALINGLVSGQQYTVCVQAVTPSVTAGEYACKTVTLPVALGTTSSGVTDVVTTVGSMAVTTTGSQPPTLTISLTTTASDNSVTVAWSITSGDAASVAQFRITWSVQGGTDVGTAWIHNDGIQREYVAANLTAMTSYLICVQAIAADSNLVTMNKTVCQVVRTTDGQVPTTSSALPTGSGSEFGVNRSQSGNNSSSTLIIIIAVCVCVSVLLILIIILVICLYRRRQRNLRTGEAGTHAKSTADSSSCASTTRLETSESMRSTHSLNDDRLAEQSVVSIDIYRDIP